MTIRRVTLLSRKYGIVAVLTGQWRRIRHAGVGRAKRIWGYGGSHTGARVADHPARLLLHRLEQERMYA
jgi:hypothetical protein